MKQKQKIKGPKKGEKIIRKHAPTQRSISPETKKRRLVLAFIVGISGFLLYSNTFSHGYVLDDFSTIKENNIVRQGIHAIPEIFKTSYRQGYLSIKDGLYRPLSLATYAIEWNYFPDKPSIGHFVNVVLYGITGMLLFFLLCNFTAKENERAAEVFAFIASLLFIVHPLHAEVVANIKSRDEMLCFLFVVCSFLFVFRFIENREKKFLGFGILTYFLSLLSKETSITFLALLPLSLYFFSSASIKKNISITACFLGTAAMYLLIRHSVLQGAMANEAVSLADNIMVGAKTFSTHMGTSFYILGLYVKLLLFPHPLSYDYSFNQIPIVSLGNIFSIISLLFYTAIGSYASFIFYHSFKQPGSGIKNQESQIISFGILFFLITIFLFSNLVLIIGTSMGDRLMYFPSLGFCICLSILLVKLLRIETIDIKQLSSNAKFIPVLIIVILFGFKTYSRNADWKDNYTLYSHDVTVVPNSVKAHYYLGLELVKVVAVSEQDAEKKKKIYEEGIAELEKAVTIFPAFAGAYTQMGVAYYRMKNYEKAIQNYNKAIELNPVDAI
ncbi:MAG: tetratricopeptide repeat protein, partial [Bacteroidia bacterium]